MGEEYTKFEHYYDDLFNSDTNKNWKVDDDRLIRLNKDKDELYFYHIGKTERNISLYGFNWLIDLYKAIFGFTLIKDKQIIDLSILERFKLHNLIYAKIESVKYVTSLKNENKSRSPKSDKPRIAPAPQKPRSQNHLDYMDELAKEWDLRYKKLREKAQDDLDKIDRKLKDINERGEKTSKVKEKLEKKLKNRMDNSITMGDLVRMKKLLE